MGGVDKLTTTEDHAAADKAPNETVRTPNGPGATKLQHVLSRGLPAHADVAEILVEAPGETNELVRILQTSVGNGYTMDVLDAVNSQVVRADSKSTKVAAEKPHIGKDRYQSGNFGTDPTDTSYLKSMHVAAGGATIDSVATDAHEATVLNKIRADSRRFNPAFLLALQQALKVSNASGSFNTETLRKLLAIGAPLAKYKVLDDKNVGTVVAIILDNKANWLAHPDPSMAQPLADPPFTDAGGAWGADRATALAANDTDPKQKRADRMAKALGYTSYTDYAGKMQPAKFLGVDLTGGASSGMAHPAVIARLGVAEAWLKQRNPGKDNKQIRDAIGWTHPSTGNAAYGDTEAEIGKNGVGKYGFGPHFHSAGLAVDIDPGRNPWIFVHEDTKYWNPNMEMHLRRSAQLFGGEAVTAAKVSEWGAKLSSEEMFAKIEKADQSFEQYLALPKSIALPADLTVAKTTKKDRADQRVAADAVRATELAKKFVAIGYTQEEADRAATDLLDFAESGRPNREKSVWAMAGRDKADGLTTHKQDLVIAMRDVAGFSWGATDIDHEGGDFMHFDLRHTSYGAALSAFALNPAQHKMTDEEAASVTAAANATTAPANTTPAKP